MNQTWFQRRALATIAWYQRLVDGRPSPCRFFPSCSAYASEAFAVHGTRRGAYLTVRRLLRCRPLGPSGFDPVPDSPTAAAENGPGSPARSTSPTTFEDC